MHITCESFSIRFTRKARGWKKRKERGTACNDYMYHKLISLTSWTNFIHIIFSLLQKNFFGQGNEHNDVEAEKSLGKGCTEEDIFWIRTLPEEAMPLTIQRNTMIQAASRLTTTHQFRLPRSSTDGEMLRVSRYQKYVVGLLICNHSKNSDCLLITCQIFNIQCEMQEWWYIYLFIRRLTAAWGMTRVFSTWFTLISTYQNAYYITPLPCTLWRCQGIQTMATWTGNCRLGSRDTTI